MQTREMAIIVALRLCDNPTSDSQDSLKAHGQIGGWSLG
jgi:hypothetical protein